MDAAQKRQKRIPRHRPDQRLTRGQKHDLLFENGINFNELPAWQKRGFGVYFQTALKEGFNPQTGETVQWNAQSCTQISSCLWATITARLYRKESLEAV